jgi:hypothetical protein
MEYSAAAQVINAYLDSHQLILTFSRKLSEEQLRWRSSEGSHAIAFHVWHVARWADHLQASIPGMTPELARRLTPGFQIWEADKVADRWGFDATQLGYAATGQHMPDDVALRLPFPDKAALVDYLEKAFAAAERAVKAIDDEQFRSLEQPQLLTEGVWGEGTVGDAIIEHLTHDNRHLGMMECLLGLQGQRGTATS